MRHSAFQRMIYDAVQYRMAKAAPAKMAAKPVPKVQKPGVSAPRGNGDAIGALSAKLTSTGSVDDAYALYKAKQKRA